jgi:regulator of replication initiation timing
MITENLLQKLEERVMILLSEIEDLRKEVNRLTDENKLFSTEKESHSRKLQDLISLLDAVNPPDGTMNNIAMLSTKNTSQLMQDRVDRVEG